MKKRKNTVKKSLLISMAAVALSCAMLVGSTYAWFTDNATSGTNNIVAGNLDIELQYTTNLEDENSWENADGQTQLFNKLTDQTLWEPGVMFASSPIRLKNEGNLALKYLLKVTAGKVSNVNGKSLTDVLRMVVVDAETYNEKLEECGIQTGEEADSVTFAQRMQMWDAIKDESVNHYGGNLTSFSQEGVILPDGKQTNSVTTGADIGKTDPMVVVLFWQPGDNDNDYNLPPTGEGDEVQPQLTIEDFGITVTATQTPYEDDSFGPNYDEGLTMATSPEDIEQAIHDALDNLQGAEDGAPVTVELPSDSEVDFTDSNEYGGGVGVVITDNQEVDITVDGNGSTIEVGHSAFNNSWAEDGTTDYLEGIKNGKFTFNDITFKNNADGHNGFAIVLGFDSDVEVVFENCTFDGLWAAVYGNPSTGGYSSNITFKNCTFTNCEYGASIDSDEGTYNVTFEEDCNLNGVPKFESLHGWGNHNND